MKNHKTLFEISKTTTSVSGTKFNHLTSLEKKSFKKDNQEGFTHKMKFSQQTQNLNTPPYKS